MVVLVRLVVYTGVNWIQTSTTSAPWISGIFSPDGTKVIAQVNTSGGIYRYMPWVNSLANSSVTNTTVIINSGVITGNASASVLLYYFTSTPTSPPDIGTLVTTLTVPQASSFNTNISGLTPNTTYWAAWYSSDTLLTSNGSTSVTTTFTTTNIIPPPVVCFLEGSKILTANDLFVEQYQNIENIKHGMLVKILNSQNNLNLQNNYKKVTHIGKTTIYPQKKHSNPIDKLYRLSTEEYDEIYKFGEDLYITGAHSILVDTLTKKQREETIKQLGGIYITDDKYRLMACLDDRAEVCNKDTLFESKRVEPPYTIWHLALENTSKYENYGIYANGLLVESCSQRMFEEFSNLK